MSSLGEELPKEIERVREMIKEYESVPNGQFAASHMKEDIRKAQYAIQTGDIAAMISVYTELKGYE